MSPRKVKLWYIHNVTEEEEVVGGLSEHFLSLYCAEVWECTQSLHHEQLEGKKTFCYKPGVVSVLCFQWTHVLLLWTVEKGGAGEVVLMCVRSIMCTCPDSAQNKPPQSGALTLIWKLVPTMIKKKYPKFKSTHDKANT